MQSNINFSHTNHILLLNRLLYLAHGSLRVPLHIPISNCQPQWPSSALCKMLENDQEQCSNNFTSMLKCVWGEKSILLRGTAGTHFNRIYQKNFFASGFRMTHNWSQEESSANLWTKHTHDTYFGKFNYSALGKLQHLEEILFFPHILGLVICKGTNNI